MRDSDTFQAILEEGREEGMQQGRALGELDGERRMLLRLGAKRLGDPTPEIVSALTAIADSDRLLEMADRVLRVESWSELLEGDLPHGR